MRIAAAQALLDRLVAEAAASPAREICGLLFGDPSRIGAAQATANVADDPAARFEIDPAALLAALRAERNGGPQLIGHYHSHPNGSTAPSPRDLAAAEPGRLWLIIAGGTVRAWFSADGRFVEVALLIDC